jgi:hypothetical protein
MKKNQPQNVTVMSSVIKAISTALSNLFFSNNNKDFERLKNFITS